MAYLACCLLSMALRVAADRGLAFSPTDGGET